MTALWTSEEIAAATGGTLHGAPFEVTGATFDSREVEHGWLFVAMPGTVADGHDYVVKAFAAGAAGALVSRTVDGPHILVADTTEALELLGAAARERARGPIIGVTGSVGKTGVKEAIFAAHFFVCSMEYLPCDGGTGSSSSGRLKSLMSTSSNSASARFFASS